MENKTRKKKINLTLSNIEEWKYYINSEFVKEINSLIKKSFGKNFLGNYKVQNFDTYGSDYLVEGSNLNLIARKTFLEGLLSNYGKVGVFLENNKGIKDGSVIYIKEKYIKNAEKYAQMYKESFGKKVKIHLERKFPDWCQIENHS